MEFAALFALGAALSWTLAGLFGHGPARALGSMHYNRIRMVVAALMVLPAVFWTNGWASWQQDFLLPILISSFLGVFLGDFFLFYAMKRIGPRRTGILFAANAPMAAVLSWVILGESLSVMVGLALLLGVLGVILAVVYGKQREALHVWEEITPPLWIGLGAGLLAALGQALGVMAMRPVMAGGLDPYLASFLRVSAAAVFFWISYPFDKQAHSLPIIPRGRLAWMVLGNGFFGLGFGVVLLLIALQSGQVAMVTMLSSVGPVMMLPILWVKTGKSPIVSAWLGAILVVLSTAILALG
ncbi:MAG: DMT family transporter [Candidatus Puniceispirillaceae bacterium]